MKMNELDGYIIHNEGIWPAKNGDSVRLGILNAMYFKSEFQQRAKELGFAGKYRWGVEYKADGKRPELADDVVVSIDGFVEGGVIYGSAEVGVIDDWLWHKINSFKITDQRYKPADTSYLDKPDSSTDNTANWYDYDNQKALRLPPVGVECEVQGKDNVGYRSFCKVRVVHQGTTKTVFEALGDLASTRKGDCMIFDTEKLEFRPLDHDRKDKAERRSTLDAIYSKWNERGDITEVAEWIYESGFRLPD
jgi:hypothetical protein